MRFPHPDYLLPLLTWEQFSEWKAFFLLAPWGEGRDDDRLTVLCSYLLAPHLREKIELPPTHHPYGAHDRQELEAAVREYKADQARDRESGVKDG